MHRIYFGRRCVRFRTESAYRLFCSLFRQVNAAGGMVSDDSGRVLMIRRNGLWDLPKGHQEPGEAISLTAVREVSEETGVTDIELRDLICITDHTYRRDGRWHLKHTWWYDMHVGHSSETVPQTEEGIECAVWVEPDRLSACMGQTYPSIAEVISTAGR